MNVGVQILAILIAVCVEIVLRSEVRLSVWVSGLMALGAYMLVLLGTAFTLWLRTEHKYQRLELPSEDGW